MEAERVAGTIREILDAAEHLVELVNSIDLPDPDPIRFGQFNDLARQYVRDAVRFCWAYARLVGLQAGELDKRLVNRAFYNAEEDR